MEFNNLGNGDSIKFVKVGKKLENVAVYSDETFASMIRLFKGVVPSSSLTCMVMKKPLQGYPKVAFIKDFLYLRNTIEHEKAKLEVSTSKRSYCFNANNVHAIELSNSMSDEELLTLMKTYAGEGSANCKDYLIVAIYNPTQPETYWIGQSDGTGGILVTPIADYKN